MLGFILETFRFFLPAMFVNLSLYLTSKVFGSRSVLSLDQGFKVGQERLIGDGRGLTSLPRALVAGALCGAFQGRLEEAVLLSIGAQAGMVFNSFIKRRLGKPQGANFYPWDHIDYILGACLIWSSQFGVDLPLFISGVLCGGLTHWALGGLIRWALESER